MTEAERTAICRLDVTWAHRKNIAAYGHPFRPGRSTVNGQHYSADENALIALHKLRALVGDPEQMATSKAWLKSEGLHDLMGRPIP